MLHRFFRHLTIPVIVISLLRLEAHASPWPASGNFANPGAPEFIQGAYVGALIKDAPYFTPINIKLVHRNEYVEHYSDESGQVLSTAGIITSHECIANETIRFILETTIFPSGQKMKVCAVSYINTTARVGYYKAIPESEGECPDAVDPATTQFTVDPNVKELIVSQIYRRSDGPLGVPSYNCENGATLPASPDLTLPSILSANPAPPQPSPGGTNISFGIWGDFGESLRIINDKNFGLIYKTENWTNLVGIAGNYLSSSCSHGSGFMYTDLYNATMQQTVILPNGTMSIGYACERGSLNYGKGDIAFDVTIVSSDKCASLYNYSENGQDALKFEFRSIANVPNSPPRTCAYVAPTTENESNATTTTTASQGNVRSSLSGEITLVSCLLAMVTLV